MRREGHSEATKKLFGYGYDRTLVLSKIRGTNFSIIIFTQTDLHNIERIDHHLFCVHMIFQSDYEPGKAQKVGFLEN